MNPTIEKGLRVKAQKHLSTPRSPEGNELSPLQQKQSKTYRSLRRRSTGNIFQPLTSRPNFWPSILDFLGGKSPWWENKRHHPSQTFITCGIILPRQDGQAQNNEIAMALKWVRLVRLESQGISTVSTIPILALPWESLGYHPLK